MSYCGCSYYFTGSSMDTWEEADTKCKGLGAKLPTVKNQRELSGIVNFMKSSTNDFQFRYFMYMQSKILFHVCSGY